MPRIIADSGPLIALFDRDDPRHQTALGFFRSWQGSVHSTWPVATEVSHMLGYSVDVQLDFLRWAVAGGLRLDPMPEPCLPRIVQVTEKYRELPMDLADASLIVLAEATGIRDIATFDSDFDAYRLADRQRLRNLIPIA